MNAEERDSLWGRTLEGRQEVIPMQSLPGGESRFYPEIKSHTPNPNTRVADSWVVKMLLVAAEGNGSGKALVRHEFARS